jgi:cell division transport system permease protein
MRHLRQLIPDDEGANRYLPWVIAIILFLTELAVAAGMSMNSASRSWQTAASGTITIEIIAGQKDTDARVEKVLQAITGAEGVEQAHELPAGAITELLSPWLGDGENLEKLPLPRLIDVTLSARSAEDIDRISKLVYAADPGANIDDHGIWLERLQRLVVAIRGLSYAIVALAAAALSLIIIFGTRAATTAHYEVVELLHLMGARDEDIANRFQRHAVVIAFRGGMIGLALAAAAILLISQLAAGIEAPLLSDMRLSKQQIAILAFIPFPATLLAGLIARYTVMRELSRNA